MINLKLDDSCQKLLSIKEMRVMARGYNRSGWILLLLIICGLVVGGFLGELLGSYIPVLQYGYNLEVTPHTWSLGIFSLTFGISLKINMFSVLGIAAGIFMFKKM